MGMGTGVKRRLVSERGGAATGGSRYRGREQRTGEAEVVMGRRAANR